jgi:hypothetical protein
MANDRSKAAENSAMPASWIAAGLIIGCWIDLVLDMGWLVWRQI